MIKKKPKISDNILYSYDLDERKLYNTREKIMNAELIESENGRINWESFDRLASEARQKIEEEIAASRAEKQKRIEEEQKRIEKEPKKNDYASDLSKPIYVYNMKGEQVDYFDNESDFLIKYKMAKATLKGYINSKLPYCNELIFSYSVISDFSPYNESKSVMKAPKKVYVYNLDSGEEIGVFGSAVAASRALGLNDNAASSAIYLHNGINRKRNLKFSYTKI